MRSDCEEVIEASAKLSVGSPARRWLFCQLHLAELPVQVADSADHTDLIRPLMLRRAHRSCADAQKWPAIILRDSFFRRVTANGVDYHWGDLFKAAVLSTLPGGLDRRGQSGSRN